jgi:aminomethyltransferase
MPLRYADQTALASHHHTRTHASLFDVSHMAQHRVSGPGAVAWLERLLPAALTTLAPMHALLSVLLARGTGGIVDDVVLARLGPQEFALVSNAGRRDAVAAFLAAELAALGPAAADVVWRTLDGWGLVALQGPGAAGALALVLDDPAPPRALAALLFGQCMHARLRVAGRGALAVFLTRTGYTGEDGFEISAAPADAAAVAAALLGAGDVRLAGLAARDSLRLEAGMCLYGHELDETTTPAEAGLGWVVARARRAADVAGFNGADVVLSQLAGGPRVRRRRVGLLVEGAPARHGASVVVPGVDNIVGAVTSGGPSPTLGRNIAMAYVPYGLHRLGTRLGVVVRGRQRPAVVTKMPFVETRYWRGEPAGSTK